MVTDTIEQALSDTGWKKDGSEFYLDLPGGTREYLTADAIGFGADLIAACRYMELAEPDSVVTDDCDTVFVMAHYLLAFDRVFNDYGLAVDPDAVEQIMQECLWERRRDMREHYEFDVPLDRPVTISCDKAGDVPGETAFCGYLMATGVLESIAKGTLKKDYRRVFVLTALLDTLGAFIRQAFREEEGKSRHLPLAGVLKEKFSGDRADEKAICRFLGTLETTGVSNGPDICLDFEDFLDLYEEKEKACRDLAEIIAPALSGVRLHLEAAPWFSSLETLFPKIEWNREKITLTLNGAAQRSLLADDKSKNILRNDLCCGDNACIIDCKHECTRHLNGGKQ